MQKDFLLIIRVFFYHINYYNLKSTALNFTLKIKGCFWIPTTAAVITACLFHIENQNQKAPKQERSLLNYGSFYAQKVF